MTETPDDAPEMTKPCSFCGWEKPLSAFYKHPLMRMGLQSICKDCNKFIGRLRYKKATNPNFGEEEFRRAIEAFQSEQVLRRSEQLQSEGDSNNQ